MKKSYDNVWYKVNEVFNKSKVDILLSSFVVWVSVFMVMLFPLFGFALAFFVMAFCMIGFKNNVVYSMQNKKIRVESIFAFYKDSISAFCLQVCTFVLVGLWSILFIVPGVVAGLNYSFAPYVFADNPKLGTLGCLAESKKLVYGKRLEIFLIYLFEVFFVVICNLVFSSLMIILSYFATVPLWTKLVLPMLISLFVFFVFIYPYFEMLIASYYLETKSVPKQKNLKQNAKSSSNIQ